MILVRTVIVCLSDRFICYWVRALTIPMHLGLKNVYFVPVKHDGRTGVSCSCAEIPVVPQICTVNIFWVQGQRKKIYIYIYMCVCVQLNLHTLRQIGLRFRHALHSYKREYLVATQSEDVFWGSNLTFLMSLLTPSKIFYATILNYTHLFHKILSPHLRIKIDWGTYLKISTYTDSPDRKHRW
jgi:hypothetical protein